MTTVTAANGAVRLLAIPALCLLALFHLVPHPADAQVSRNLTLLSHMDLYDEYFACWSYVHEDGREYAIILTTEGASIVRLTDPANPVEVGFFVAPAGLFPRAPIGRAYVEAKQYGHYLYLVTEYVRGFDDTMDPDDEGMAIIDMRNPDRPRKVAALKSPIVNAHTITIDQDRGLLFANGTYWCEEDFSSCSFGLKIFSLADPEDPQLLYFYPDYVHDTHVRGNRAYLSMIFAEGNDGLIIVLDLTDPSNPTELARIVTPRWLQHSAWTSEDGRYLYAANEVTRDGLTVWDVSDLSNIRQVFTFEDLPEHVVHQPHVVGNTLSLAYYTAGVRLMDIRNPAWPVEFAHYDTYDGAPGYYDGAWECAPFFPSGILAVSDIQSGLWVFRANPTNHGIVRGTVREAPNGPTIAGATVTVQPAGLTVKSGQDGRYAFAVPATGAATLTVSTYGFEVASSTVGVPLDSDQTLNFGLRRLPSGSLRGFVRDASGASVAGAEIQVLDTPHRAVTDASGAYAISSVPEGPYQVRAARPGLAASTRAATVQRGNVSTRDFTLGGVSFYDDAETDRGWLLTDPNSFIVSGFWERVAPLQKIQCDTGDELQPGQDHTPGSGTNCFITGNRSTPCVTFSGGVAGVATLTSPSLPMAGITDPRIGYWYWFVNAIQRVPGQQPLLVRLSNDGGANWVTAKTILGSTYAWEFDEIRVTDYFPSPGDVRVRFVVDNSAFSLAFRPEAGVDDIAVYAGGGGGSLAGAATAQSAPAVVIGAPRPNPTPGITEVELSLGRAERVRAEVFDLQGRLVTVVADRLVPSGRTMIRWDGRTRGGAPAASGIYWMALRAGDLERRIRLVVVR
ncbi:MAG TPA: choice-of-anchor B family protein [Candidatus Eisenbacteria bacterium]|nr:choice-of-anchor B family protein [Candidatus Eisenbacteria bacterium]